MAAHELLGPLEDGQGLGPLDSCMPGVPKMDPGLKGGHSAIGPLVARMSYRLLAKHHARWTSERLFEPPLTRVRMREGHVGYRDIEEATQLGPPIAALPADVQESVAARKELTDVADVIAVDRFVTLRVVLCQFVAKDGPVHPIGFGCPRMAHNGAEPPSRGLSRGEDEFRVGKALGHLLINERPRE